MALKLKDITNLHSNLPISQIPQQRQSRPVVIKQLSQHPPPLQHGRPILPQQHRVSLLSNDDSGCELMDDSLTDMQWLQRMDAGSDLPGLVHGPRKRMGNKGNRSTKDGCRKKLDYNSKKGTNKPPLSYASLISLAICSTPQRMMTLSSIYRWIEYTFPFYRTPEAKAWKNSIRHNLSIRKNMFMKVYQYPPRRGNGSYWTLLSDGEEELKKAVPLFATLQPPVIDSNCAYHREPPTHTVKSKGKFVPVLPRSEFSSSSISFFSADNSQSSSLRVGHGIFASNEIIVEESQGSDEFSMSMDNQVITTGRKMMLSSTVPHHLHDHSYAKSCPLDDMQEEMDETEVMELASGKVKGDVTKWNESTDSEESFSSPSTPNRKWKSAGKVKSRTYPLTSTENRTTKSSSQKSSPSFTTPLKDQDNSLHLLDTSFLTPLKNLVPDVELGAISFSPLYTNLITRGNPAKCLSQMCLLEPPSQPFFPSPLTPLKSTLDSGIFSPLRSDCLKFSTPTDLSPLGDLNSFNSLQPEFYPLKVLDNSDSSCNDTPFRPGSLQGLGLPGFTPPSRK